jgi:CheY-like chemotaxis protein
MKILVVEDDAETRRGLLRLIEDNGHIVLTAGSKNQALGLINQLPNLVKWKLDLVITDLDMGKGNDGLELLKEANAKGSPTKFWLVSSGMTEEIAAEAKILGAERVISKSDLLQELKDVAIISSN